MKEQREKERIIIKHKPQGDLKLIIEDESKTVQLIGNISPFGIMVQVKKPVDVHMDVGLIYTVKNINFEVLGTVKWARTYHQEGADAALSYSQLGISFWPQNMKENMDLFNILSGQ